MYRFSTLSSGTHKNIVVALLMTVFISTLFFSLVHIVNMHSMVSETGCPFLLTDGSICSVEISDHLSLWQNLSLATPLVLFLFLFLFLIPFVRTIITVCSQLFKQFLQIWEFILAFFLFQRAIYIPVTNYLEESFSSGVLHPKRF